MRKDKEKAFDLRKEGKTYKEISAVLGVSKSTLSGWFSRDGQFAEILAKNKVKFNLAGAEKMRFMNNTRALKLSESYKKAEEDARVEFEKLKDNPLFFTALAVYWGEGDKRTPYNIRISNTDPKLIRIFVLFSERFLGISQDKIKISLLLYPDLDDNICKEYWSNGLKLPIANFYKTIVIQGRHKINRLSYGVCSVGFSSGYLKRKIHVWLEMLGEQFEKV